MTALKQQGGSASNGINELVGHSKRVCAEEAGASRGPKYAAALFAQAAALRTAASLLEVSAMRVLIGAPPQERSE